MHIKSALSKKAEPENEVYGSIISSSLTFLKGKRLKLASPKNIQSSKLELLISFLTKPLIQNHIYL